MSLPGGGQWESAIAFLVLGFLIWELRSLRRTQREDREKARQAEAKPPE
jgi:cytochrome c-type biogenesis protein CcmH/NrfF